MSTPTRTFVVALTAAFSLAAAGLTAPISIVPLPPVAVVGGVALSVSTSAYQVTPIIGNLIHPISPPTGVVGKPIPVDPVPVPSVGQSFAASVALVNNSSAPIVFTFPTTRNGRDAFVFQVIDAGGNVVWDSTTGTAAGDIVTSATLGKHKAWRVTQAIPIILNGTPLVAGNYALKVTLEGTPQFESTLSFVVNPPIVIN